MVLAAPGSLNSPRIFARVVPRRSPGVGRGRPSTHYDDGRYYDQAYRRRRHDVRFYVDLATRIGGPVLELGVGTGRVAFALAQSGIEVVGVDAVPAMLSRAEERVAKMSRAVRSRVELRRGDLQSLRLRRRFPLVIAPFHVWNHLYAPKQIERGFATARHHLGPRGRFAFDVLVPDPSSLAREPTRRYRGGFVPHPKDGERYQYGEFFNYDPSSQIETVTMDFEHPVEPNRSFTTTLRQRQFFPAELEALVRYNGFDIETRLADFRDEPITRSTESQFILAKKSPSGAPFKAP